VTAEEELLLLLEGVSWRISPDGARELVSRIKDTHALELSERIRTDAWLKYQPREGESQQQRRTNRKRYRAALNAAELIRPEASSADS
jgi:hypothetical protein